MASTLAVSGLASTIDTKAIVEALINADRAPARLAENNRSTAQTRLNAVKAMNTKLLALRDATDAIKDKANFAVKTSSSSNEASVTVSASSSAIAGSLVVNVKKLASADQVASAGQASASTDLGAGTVVLRLASAGSSDPDITITPTTNTLTGLAEAINSANAGVSASVVNDGSGTPYRLVVTSTKTGTANAITKLDGTGGFAGVLPGLSGMTKVTTATDAEIRIGDKDTGLLLKSSSNTMDQAVPGLKLTLKTVADGVTITTSQDTSSVKSKVKSLVDTFNAANSYYTSNSTYDAATKSVGALFNEYDLRTRLDKVERELKTSNSSLPTGFQSMSDIGVKLATDGTLSLDETVFASKLAENQDAVASLFLSSGSAIGVQLDSLTRSVDGTMALKTATLETAIQNYTDSITKIDSRLEKRKAYYEAKFLQMEKLTAQYQSQGNSLTSFITGLNASSSK